VISQPLSATRVEFQLNYWKLDRKGVPLLTHSIILLEIDKFMMKMHLTQNLGTGYYLIVVTEDFW